MTGVELGPALPPASPPAHEDEAQAAPLVAGPSPPPSSPAEDEAQAAPLVAGPSPPPSSPAEAADDADESGDTEAKDAKKEKKRKKGSAEKEEPPKVLKDKTMGQLKHEELDWIWIGDAEDARDKTALQKNNIRYVLNCTPPRNEQGVANFHEKDPWFSYCRVAMGDNATELLSTRFEEAWEFFERVRVREDGGILVHCQQGVSRSCSMVIAYIMKYYRFSFDDALTLVKLSRKQAQPNEGFTQQLKDFDETLRSTDGYEKVPPKRRQANLAGPGGPSVGPARGPGVGPARGPVGPSGPPRGPVGPARGPVGPVGPAVGPSRPQVGPAVGPQRPAAGPKPAPAGPQAGPAKPEKRKAAGPAGPAKPPKKAVDLT